MPLPLLRRLYHQRFQARYPGLAGLQAAATRRNAAIGSFVSQHFCAVPLAIFVSFASLFYCFPVTSEDIAELVCVTTYALWAVFPFVFLCAAVEYAERNGDVRSICDLKTICALLWLHLEVYAVLARPLFDIRPLSRHRGRFERWRTDRRAYLLNAIVRPRDFWLSSHHGWVGDALRYDLGDGRTTILSLPNILSLFRCLHELVKINDQQQRSIRTLRTLWNGAGRFGDRCRGLEEKVLPIIQRIDGLNSGIQQCQRRVALGKARHLQTMRRLLLLLRVYHVVVWRHTVELKTKLRRTTQDYTETLETLSVLSADHESLLIGYEAALEDGQDLCQELAYQHDKLCEAEDEIAEWQTVAEGVCFSHTQEMNEFEMTKANMSKTISDLLVFLHLLWWFSMALKAEFAARGRLDREDILALRRRLMLVENANFAVAKALAKWRALYEESEVALQEVVELYSQQRITYQAHSRQLLTGLLLLWRYSRNLGQELFDARFRMYMCPVSCRRTSDDVSLLPAPQPPRALLLPADSMEGINESDLTAEQILSLRFSRTNIAYASLSVQYELLHTELDDVYEDLREAQQERVAEKEKLQADLSDARKAIEELRTASGAESGKLRSALDEAEKTIMTLRAAKDTAEEELKNKRNEMVLARVTVQQMRAEVEETKRNLESRVVEWSAFAAGSGRPMLLSEPRDDGDFLAAAGQGVIPLDRRQSPPMLMERRDRTPLLDAPEMVTHPPSASAPIERRMPSGSSSSSQSHSHPSGLALAGLQPPMVCTPSPSHAVSSVIGMPGAIDFPETPVPFRPNISLYSGSPHPIVQPRPVSAQQSSTLFARPRSPRLVIEANSDSDDESPVAYDSDNESPVITDSDNEFPVASDRSSSPEQGYFTPALQASEF